MSLSLVTARMSQIQVGTEGTRSSLALLMASATSPSGGSHGQDFAQVERKEQGAFSCFGSYAQTVGEESREVKAETGASPWS